MGKPPWPRVVLTVRHMFHCKQAIANAVYGDAYAKSAAQAVSTGGLAQGAPWPFAATCLPACWPTELLLCPHGQDNELLWP